MYVSRKVIGVFIAAATVLVLVSSASSAVAIRLITGADVKDGSLTGADIKRDSVPGNRIKDGSVRMEHLDRDSIRAGHVHVGTPPLVVRSGAKRSEGVPRDSSEYVYLNTGVSKNILRLSQLPPGSYIVLVSGELQNYATKVGTVFATYASFCSVLTQGASGSSMRVDNQNNQVPPTSSAGWTTLLNMTKAITLTETSDIVLMCGASVNPSTPAPTSPIATVSADLVAFPVTSFAAR